MKLEATTARDSFNYLKLLAKIYPFIKPYLSRVILGFLIAIPVG